VRASNGTTPTNYTYTGQYSNMGDFGLMFYNARWYDPTIGRFAQADTLIPDGVQGWDRYAYVSNNPLRYIDPSGHEHCDADGYCGDVTDDYAGSQNQTTNGGITDQEAEDIIDLSEMGDVIAYNLNGTVQYAMFVLNGTNGVQLWDMASHQIISLKEIQSEVIGFYQ